MASACLYLFFAKPNLMVNTDLLIILSNYFSLIYEAEVLYPPQFYLKRSILIQDPCKNQSILLNQALLLVIEAVNPTFFGTPCIFLKISHYEEMPIYLLLPGKRCVTVT